MASLPFGSNRLENREIGWSKRITTNKKNGRARFFLLIQQLSHALHAQAYSAAL